MRCPNPANLRLRIVPLALAMSLALAAGCEEDPITPQDPSH